MDYKEAKDWLKSYRDYKNRLKYVDVQIENLRAISYGNNHGGRSSKNINDWIDEKYSIKKEMSKIEDAVDSVHVYNHKNVLRYRYLEDARLEDAAEYMGYSMRYISKFHSAGIREIASMMSGE